MNGAHDQIGRVADTFGIGDTSCMSAIMINRHGRSPKVQHAAQRTKTVDEGGGQAIPAIDDAPAAGKRRACKCSIEIKWAQMEAGIETASAALITLQMGSRCGFQGTKWVARKNRLKWTGAGNLVDLPNQLCYPNSRMVTCQTFSANRVAVVKPERPEPITTAL